MNYKQTTQWLFEQLPMYQTQGASAYKNDLSTILLLANYLQNPEKKLKTIHIAGTNGKGSTSSMLASVLQEAGYKVGLYTSPHLKNYRERIKINGKKINKKFVVDFVAKHKDFFEAHQLSFFEMTVGLAYDYFEKENVEIAIIEVGLGGRLDATNIITPLVAVITNIGLDHTQFLGNTLEKIATEKAGIIKKNIPVVIGETTTETKPVFIEIAKKNNSKIYFAEENAEENYTCELLGNYQKKNIKTVLQTLEILKNDFPFSEENKINGLQNVVKNTKLLGRWQVLQQKPFIVCDTAHNAHGLQVVLQQLQQIETDQLHIVLGVVNDKDLDSILPLFPKNAMYYFCKPKNYRGLDVAMLQEKALEYHLIGSTYTTVKKALAAAKNNAKKEDTIYIGGSTFVVAEVV